MARLATKKVGARAALAGQTATKLYTPNLLSLATRLSEFPLDQDFDYRAEARSRTCGSMIDLGVNLDGDGRVKAIGMQVSACAIGQSSAAIMALGVEGRLGHEIAAMKGAIEAWLNCEDTDTLEPPDWPGFEALIPAHAHKGRHGALLLAWTALTQALSSSETAR